MVIISTWCGALSWALSSENFVNFSLYRVIFMGSYARYWNLGDVPKLMGRSKVRLSVLVVGIIVLGSHILSSTPLCPFAGE